MGTPPRRRCRFLQMWFPEQKPVKHSVHIPCWDSYRILPWRWRGFCFGR